MVDRDEVNKQTARISYLKYIIFNETIASTLNYIQFFFLPQSLMTIFLIGAVIYYFEYKATNQNINSRSKFRTIEIRKRDFLKIGHWLEQNIVGQTKGMRECLAQIYNRVYFNRNETHLGSYFIFGPAGNGKTLFAKILSESLFGAKSLLHLCLSRPNIDSLDLLNQIKLAMQKNQSLVILLEEIDKAPPEILHELEFFLNQEYIQSPSLVIIATANTLYSSENFPAKIQKTILPCFDGIYFFSELSPTDVAKVVLVQLKKYYSQANFSVDFLCFESVAGIVKEKRQVQEFGAKQLLREVRLNIEKTIFEAKRNGFTEIEISYHNKQFSVKPKSVEFDQKIAA
jgi:ATP-dependent Clp protease ATP-binding subunit ClpA